MSIPNKIFTLVLITLILSGLFLFYKLPNNWEYALERRSFKVASMLIVSCCIAYSSLVFQTLTNNKILTPSIMGFEAVYLLFQTLIVFVYGDKTFQVIKNSDNFFISIGLMMLFAFLLFILIFKRGKSNMYFLLLIGLVLGTLFGTVSSFLQLVIDPNEFLIIEGQMFASFNKINTDLFWYALAFMILSFIIGFRQIKNLDVIALGKEAAVNLGLDYDKTVKLYLFIIAVLVAVSTALVGPMTFLGILVTNLTYELFKTYKHSILIPACCLVSCIAVLGGQFIVEQVFNFNTTISIIINFVGGIYFMFLLLKAKKI
ncbi:MAG: iron chelate uptake ABC transporter family permease subunit [Weeksellaceae bacterium]|jgi:iron complex transport system permease protein|nr:iron chelate uptake ABC transporter family permease subunit [Weeksellaceae bacterium]